jgi:RNA polymerase sigma factor (sigma-70 family)
MAAVPSRGYAAAANLGVAPAALTTQELYERCGQQIFRFCQRQLRNREEAEDATQTTFLNAFRGLERGSAVEFESAWLYKIALNVCMSRQRSQRRGRLELVGDFDEVQDRLPARDGSHDELFGLDVALRRMPEQQRRALRAVLLGAAALVVDLGYAYSAQRDLQSSADSAALAGAEGLPDVDNARLLAQEYGSGDKNAHSSVGGVQESITTTCVDGTSGCPDDAIVVSEVGHPQSFLSKLFGISSFKVTVKSAACLDNATGQAILIGANYTGGSCTIAALSNPGTGESAGSGGGGGAQPVAADSTTTTTDATTTLPTTTTPAATTTPTTPTTTSTPATTTTTPVTTSTPATTTTTPATTTTTPATTTTTPATTTTTPATTTTTPATTTTTPATTTTTHTTTTTPTTTTHTTTTTPTTPSTTTTSTPALGNTVLSTRLSVSPIPVGQSVYDTATLTNVTSDASGSVSYRVFSDSGCTQNPINAGTVTVSHGVVPTSNPVTFNLPGTFYWQANYTGDSHNKPFVSPCTDEVLTTYAACALGYPDSSSALSSTTFNESEVLAGFAPSIAGPNDTIKAWYSDEHALTLGIRQVVVKTSTGSTTTNYPLAPLTSNPGTATNPAVGATIAQGGVDPSKRPVYPALFVTDITSNPTSRAGDWQQGSTEAIPPTQVFGTWKGAVETIDKTQTQVSKQYTVTPDTDPAKNGWNLGPGSDAPPAGIKGQQWGAEARWSVASLGLQPGHAYRMEFLVHDGDQNNGGGDSGEACMTVVDPS